VTGVECGPSALKPYRRQIGEIRPFDKVDVGCIVRLQAQNVGDETYAIETSYAFGWRPVVGRSDGRTFKAATLTLEGPEVKRDDWGAPKLPPGAKGTVVLGVSADIQPTGEGAPRPRLLLMNPFISTSPILLSIDAPPDRAAPDGG